MEILLFRELLVWKSIGLWRTDMSKEQLDLIHYQNKCHQLTQLLEASEKENKRLKRILAELSFDAKGWLAKLGRI